MTDDHTREGTAQEKAEARALFGNDWQRIEAVIGRAPALLNSRDSGTRRYIRLVEIATEFSEIVAPYAACRGKGCSHCCKQAVNITEREALRIGNYLGRAPARVAQETDPLVLAANLDADVARYTGQACPMLATDGSCSVYPVRPLACVLSHSLEETPEPCNLETGRHWVKKLNTMTVTSVSVVMDITRPIGDIREFFP